MVSASRFFSRRQVIYIEDSFLSTRIIREALERKFRVVVIEESGNHLRLRIIRFLRIYGGPMIWPQASIDITIEKLGAAWNIYWYFTWPEYFILFFGLPILFALVSTDSGFTWMTLTEVIIFFVFSFLFFGLLIFMDTLWVSSRVRKTFERL